MIGWFRSASEAEAMRAAAAAGQRCRDSLPPAGMASAEEVAKTISGIKEIDRTLTLLNVGWGRLGLVVQGFGPYPETEYVPDEPRVRGQLSAILKRDRAVLAAKLAEWGIHTP